MNRRLKLMLGSGAAVAMAAAAPMVAHATPYALAFNQITGLTLTYNTTPATGIGATTANQQVSDSSVFGSFTGASGLNTQTVGTATAIPQSYAGPGPTPAAAAGNTLFDPIGAGNFTGTRSDAAISAGTGTGNNATGVSVSNVAEGYGNSNGTSVGGNRATITFTVSGSGKALNLSFTDFYKLITSTTASPNESATASITNTFSVTPSTSSTPIYSAGPKSINAEISSLSGVPAMTTATNTIAYSLTTPTLLTGTTYNISLSSSSTEYITPGTAVPEPGSLLLLGTGVLGIGMLGLRRRRL